MNTQNLNQIPELEPLLAAADHVDVKTVEGGVTLREFICNMFAYSPAWVKSLYRVRTVFVRMLGMKQEGIPQEFTMRPQDVPMTVGSEVSFFKVAAAREERLWVAGIHDKHLSAWLAIIAEGQPGTSRRFHVVTAVKYNNWAGPVYFNVIRPFHHLVVGQMAKAAVRPQAQISRQAAY